MNLEYDNVKKPKNHAKWAESLQKIKFDSKKQIFRNLLTKIFNLSNHQKVNVNSQIN